MRNSRKLFIVFFFLFTLVGSARLCQAVPSQFGDSGLVSQPTAETLNSGNICVGFIGNCAVNDVKTATVIPVFMTLGLGSFLEAYGSYPNILFNESEEDSGRGYSNVGFKIRVLGKRSSQFKLGIDGQLRRTVSKNINYDGLTDQLYRVIASYNNGKFGLHGNAGFINPESPQYISYEKQLIYGGGLEYLPNSRLRLLTEIGIESSKSQGLSDLAEVTAGFQYFLSPHLTLNLALAKGFTDESPDWRALFGFSSCQGIGTYQRPIPRKVAPQTEQPEEVKVEVKALKVRTLTPLSPKKKVVEPVKSSSKYEVPVGEQAEVVTLSPVSAVSDVSDMSLSGGPVVSAVATAAAPLAISSGIPLLQVAPEIAGTIAATALALPVNDAMSLSAPRLARSYKLNEVVKTDEDQVVGKKIVEDFRYQAKFYSIVETPTTFTATLFHKYDKPLDVWIEGAGKANTKLSQSKAAPYEEVTLTIDKVNGKVPYFKLHIGELSEVFEFFPLRKSVKLGKTNINIKPVNGEQGTDPQIANAGQGAKLSSPSADPSVANSPQASDKSSISDPLLEVSSIVPPEARAVGAAASNTAPVAGVVAAAPATATLPGASSVAKDATVSGPDSATTIAAGDKSPVPIPGSSVSAASASVVPVVGGVVTGLAAVVAPEVGVVATSASNTAPVAGVVAAAPATAALPGAASVVKEATVSGPDSATTIAAGDKSPVPIPGSSVSAASASVVPVVGGVVTGLAAVVAPEVGVVATSASNTAPVAGVVAAAPATAALPGAASVVKEATVSGPDSATTIAAVDKSPAPIAGSSVSAASASAAPVVGSGVTGLAAAVAPEIGVVVASASSDAPSAGAIPFSEIAASPKSGVVTTSNKIAEPTAGKLRVDAPQKTAPEAGLTKTAPEIATTPGGATVILLNSGTAPVPGEVSSGETITVRAPVSGPLAVAPTKTVQAVAYKKFRLPSTVVFAFDDATLTEVGMAAITDVVEAIKTEKRWYVLRVDGFTDNLGSDDYNIKLGLRRAISVAKYMVTNNGIDPSIVFVKSSGENDPIATNETEEGRTLNRRAEIVLFVQKEE